VTAHMGKIQDKGPAFYRQFKIIVCGLDNVAARRWINAYVHSLLEYEEGDEMETDENEAGRLVDPESVIFLIDSGTEGFKASVSRKLGSNCLINTIINQLGECSCYHALHL
jgi:ubiquitin-activating enzyme E1 C